MGLLRYDLAVSIGCRKGINTAAGIKEIKKNIIKNERKRFASFLFCVLTDRSVFSASVQGTNEER